MENVIMQWIGQVPNMVIMTGIFFYFNGRVNFLDYRVSQIERKQK